jgi:hypothetical protein
VYRDGRLVMKWNLDSSVAMYGLPRVRIRKLIETLVREGLL